MNPTQDREEYLQRIDVFRARKTSSKSHNKICIVCDLWIHRDMQDCEPCSGAVPKYSSKHQFV